MESSCREAGQSGNAGFGTGADLYGRFRLSLLGIVRCAQVDARRRGADRHRYALDDRMVIRPSDVEAL